MGTTFLMMSNKSNTPVLSPALGTRYSINGDDLAFTHAKRELQPDFGPIITTGIRYGDAVDGNGDFGRGFYVEDGGNPYLASWLVELAGVAGWFRRSLRFHWLGLLYRLGLSRTTDMGFRLAKLSGNCKSSSRSMPVLVMGRENPAGNFTLEDGILDCGWTWKASKEYYDRVARELEKMGEAMDSVCGAMPTRRTRYVPHLKDKEFHVNHSINGNVKRDISSIELKPLRGFG